ncbi:SDR family oxidoreductase [Nocardia implantans]|uniref:3-oxoacyl-[acyl-carrier-protein] reductase MabA n=1 Tax=Nocardia implantans TaxID=3108168 RepID=A0ABU6ASG7_9NOCA|nr:MULTISPECIES: SDR family oxidoreductase [unclassified Nocardia]MBF6191858.1 SDR family oxidoreductase [Nocardia beijingensis]MEA3527830.1 SDR family oxidoreductase [Nocardia sp. CDC192]MEB3510419.1 SDR family oxidoreductase [Nocardia sp. CDC186]
MATTAPLPEERAGTPRRAVVTGGDSGIGAAIAVTLAAGGADVGLTFHSDRSGAEDTAAQVRDQGRTAAVRRLDLADPSSAGPVIDELAGELGGLDVLVNCAGTGSAQKAMDMDFDTWRHVLSVDLDGAFVCSQRAAAHMIAAGAGGRIINITSVHEHVPRVGAAPYCAAKAGLGALTKVLALELAEHDITVNSVAPGEISTPMTGQEDVDPREQSRPGVPLGRTGHAKEVAAVVAFLASPEAGYVTGASYLVDGGMLLMGPQASTLLTDEKWRTP